MRISYLCVLGVLLATYACKKGGSDGPDTPAPPVNLQPTAEFKLQRYGTPDLWSLFLASEYNKTIAAIKNAAGNTGFTWEITSSNGMRKTTDTTVKGTGTTDGGGNASIKANSLYDYKDGTLTLNIRFNNSTGTTVSGTTKKEEFIISSYKDLMAINDLYTGRNPSDTYVQTGDIAFPDTVFAAAPVNPLKANYDGRGFKITNLTITIPPRGPNTPLDFVGLFSTVGAKATVKNVRLELSAAGIKTNSMSVCGGLAGNNGGTLLNCSVKGSINAGTCAFCDAGGITGETVGGRIIGCSFNGTLTGTQTGGISPSLQNSYVNMCYSNYAVFGNGGSGCLTGTFTGQSDRLIHDTVYNCYAYIKQASVSLPLKSLFATLNVLYDGCYSNHGTVQPKTISYSTAQELNSLLLPLQVSDLPADITAPPANKPFKSSTDPGQPPVLWWE